MGEEDEEEDGEEEKAKGKRGNHRPAILEDEALAGHGMGAALKVSMWADSSLNQCCGGGLFSTWSGFYFCQLNLHQKVRYKFKKMLNNTLSRICFLNLPLINFGIKKENSVHIFIFCISALAGAGPSNRLRLVPASQHCL